MTSTALTCRMAETADDLRACQELRHACFRGSAGLDCDAFDTVSSHVMIMQGGALICTMRLRVFDAQADLSGSYTGGFYKFGPFDGAALEVGRFCIRPDAFSADILRVAWGALTAWVEAYQITHLFGCASFAGTNPAPYAHALGLLATDHVRDVNIAAQQAETITLCSVGALPFDPKAAQSQLPPLLRSYLGMGGYVSAEAIIDRDLGTVLVFTGLDINAIPPARAKSLRRLAKGLHISLAHNS